MKNNSRRRFIKTSAIAPLGVAIAPSCLMAENSERASSSTNPKKPVVIATWDHGMTSNKVSWEILQQNGSALDAVEAGVRVVESDPKGSTVGIGGTPDRDGFVTLDACIMNHKNQCGSVAYMQNIENPISVARKVMEETPHVMLAGDGAYQFAREQGFPHQDLLTENSKKRWEKWLKTSLYVPVINIENHDTIGALALDSDGNLAGACTTSGMAYKMHGRVGDSPIIGAGLFVDNEVGACCATGMGEAIVRIAGSAIVVELMRNGKSPMQACQEAVERIISKHDDLTNLQVGFIALDKDGNHGGFSVYENFSYALTHENQNELLKSDFKIG